MMNDYFKLFIKREGKIVFGKACSNLWLLVIVLVVTFVAIAFSNASLDYLSDKMNDPFIKWVNIENEFNGNRFADLESALDDDELRTRFHFSDHQSDYRNGLEFFGKEESMIQYIKCRFFERINSSLVEKILEEDNVVGNASIPACMLTEKQLGLIMTQDAMARLGYDENSYPGFVDLCSYSIGADRYGFPLLDGEFAHVPLPVIAVVKKLPMNMDAIAARFLYEQKSNTNTFPLNMNSENYARSLIFFVPADFTDFSEKAALIAEGLTDETFRIDPKFMPEMATFSPGSFQSLSFDGDSTNVEITQKIADIVKKEFGDRGVMRVYDYATSEYKLIEKSFISVNFVDLESIREFECYVKENFGVSIEMSQINAKENFNSVTVMAKILSWSMLVFAIVCIILFIVNLLQSYFQKVKKNIGTFKAFGVSNAGLVNVYSLIVVAMVALALVISLTTVTAVQLVLPIAGVLKEGLYSYLNLWTVETIAAAVIILLSSACTVSAVMGILLKSTPGDLIYDR